MLASGRFTRTQAGDIYCREFFAGGAGGRFSCKKEPPGLAEQKELARIGSALAARAQGNTPI